MLASLLRLARPKDWVKSVFIVLPVPFALAARSGNIDWLHFVLATLGFCLVSSAVYAYNDTQDAETDRLHPLKKSRPVASGAVPARTALLFAAALLLGGGALLGAFASANAFGLAGIYVVANLLYSHFAKRVAPLDIFLLTSFYVLRVFLGCLLIGTTPSNWLLLCSSNLALFLVLTKRRADLSLGLDAEHRPSLSGYTLGFLEQAMGVTAGIAFLSYALYSMEAEIFIRGREFASLPFVAAGLLDYLRLAVVRGLGGSPVDLATSEPSVLICAIGWAGAVLWSLDI